jgi:hypothetical protein
MSNEQKTKLSEFREWLNLVLTIVGAVGIGYLALYAKNQRNEIRLESDAKYETIEAHNNDKIALSAIDGKLADAETKLSERHDALERLVNTTKSDTDLKIQHLTDVVISRRDYMGKDPSQNN